MASKKLDRLCLACTSYRIDILVNSTCYTYSTDNFEQHLTIQKFWERMVLKWQFIKDNLSKNMLYKTFVQKCSRGWFLDLFSICRRPINFSFGTNVALTFLQLLTKFQPPISKGKFLLPGPIPRTSIQRHVLSLRPFCTLFRTPDRLADNFLKIGVK